MRGFIERVHSPFPTTNCHYILYHAVKKDSPTTPIRIVYDCSSRSSHNAPSLNECMEIGPPFMNDLCSIILRFRLHKIAISTDMEKAFLHPNDRDYTCFLWPSDITNPNSNLQKFASRVFFSVLPVHHLCFMPPYDATFKTITQILQQICSLMFMLII